MKCYYYYPEADSLFIEEKEKMELAQQNYQIDACHCNEIGEVIEQSLNELILYLLEHKWSDESIKLLVDDKLIKELNLKI